MKLYNEKEIGAILKKAAENSSEDKSDTSMGLSVVELQQLAADAGIDPDQIVKAISEIEFGSGDGEGSFWGGPFSFNNQVVVNGEITAGEWEEMLVSIRRCFGAVGEVSSRESVLEWKSPWSSSNTGQVTALKENGKTKISVFWNGPLTALPFYIPVPLAVIASLPVAVEFLELSAVPGVSLVLLAGLLAFVGGRWALRRHVAKIFGKFKKMMSEFEVIGSRKITSSKEVIADTDSIQQDSVQESSGTTAPLLDVGAEVESDESVGRVKKQERS